MKISAFSDTHMKFPKLVPAAKYLVHAGDYQSGNVDLTEAREIALNFFRWFRKLNGQYKIFVPGNHDHWFWWDPVSFKTAATRSGIIVLDNEMVDLDGVKFFGTPYFYKHKNLEKQIKPLPEEGCDVLISHGPPFGIFDFAPRDFENCGSIELREYVKEKKIKKHIFGHIHPGYGKAAPFYNVALASDKKTKELVNPVTLIDISYFKNG